MADRVVLHSQLKDVPLSKMRVSENVQRDLNAARVARLVAEFDPENFGYPVVSARDGHFYIVDGQHRIEAVKAWLGEAWAKQSVTCRVYSGMTEVQEANMFDRLNNQLTVRAFDKFKARVTAKRPIESDVKRIVEKHGLHISRSSGEGAISTTSALVSVYEKFGADTLGRALRIVNGSFGSPGLTSHMLNGLAMLCNRYNGALNDDVAIGKLQAMRGGVGALMSRAQTLRKQTAASVPMCIAAATVDVLNAKRGGNKLPSWWKDQ